jgi:hypothetical protein
MRQKGPTQIMIVWGVDFTGCVVAGFAVMVVLQLFGQQLFEKQLNPTKLISLRFSTLRLFMLRQLMLRQLMLRLIITTLHTPNYAQLSISKRERKQIKLLKLMLHIHN